MMRPLVEALIRGGHDVLETVVERLQAGVRVASVNPSAGGTGEGEFQTLVAAELERLGCAVESWEPDAAALAERFPAARPYLPPSGFRTRPNVIGWAPTAEPLGGRRAHLILNSHADTVGAGDPSGWRFPPFSGTVADGHLHGLGAVDAKGCMFAFLGAFAVLRAAGVTLRRSVMLQSVVDEEAGGAGVLDCIRRGYTAGAALVGEPTSLRVCPGSRGSMTLVLRVVGRGAHPGEGWRGVNAIHAAWRYVEALERLRDDLDRTRMHPLWAPLPVGHVWNLMAVNSGPAGRSVPDRCEVRYSVGAIGAERLTELQDVVAACVAGVTAADPWLIEHPPTIEWSPPSMEPAVIEPTHPAVAAMVAAGVDLGEDPVGVQAFSAASDGRHLMNSGGIPAINFGPGDLHRCHSPGEELPVAELRRAMTWIALFMARYCGVARGPADR